MLLQPGRQIVVLRGVLPVRGCPRAPAVLAADSRAEGGLPVRGCPRAPVVLAADSRAEGACSHPPAPRRLRPPRPGRPPHPLAQGCPGYTRPGAGFDPRTVSLETVRNKYLKGLLKDPIL